MTVSAAGTFTVTSWQEDTYAELGGTEKITKAQMGFRLAGDLAGDLVADGGYDGGLARSTWRVIPGSGTGGLAGLTGSGSSVASAEPPGSYTLDYDLG